LKNDSSIYLDTENGFLLNFFFRPHIALRLKKTLKCPVRVKNRTVQCISKGARGLWTEEDMQIAVIAL